MSYFESDFWLLLGRFHPLIIHLPIGFFFLGTAFEFLILFKKEIELERASIYAFLLTGISGVVSVLLGLILSNEGGYNAQKLDWHAWGGILTTTMAWVIWYIKSRSILGKGFLYYLILILSVAIITFTGHFGGTLTHGSSYLTEYSPEFIKKIVGEENPSGEHILLPNSLDSAIFYVHVVRPILVEKCISCHNSEKRKGDLMLNSFAGMMKGGKNGPVIEPGIPGQSELIRRINLPENHDDVMPPEGKPSLTGNEVNLLKFWIEEGADESAYVADLNSNDTLKQWVWSYLSLGDESEIYLKGVSVPDVSDSTLNKMNSMGIIVRRLSEESHFLDVNLISIPPDSILQKISFLHAHRENVVWLDLSNKGLTDDDAIFITEYMNLVKLKLNNNNFTDEICNDLAALKNLEYVSLYGNPRIDSCAMLQGK